MVAALAERGRVDWSQLQRLRKGTVFFMNSYSADQKPQRTLGQWDTLLIIFCNRRSSTMVDLKR
jgi:hypothetical protein